MTTQLITPEGVVMHPEEVQRYLFADTETAGFEPFDHGGGICEISLREVGPRGEGIQEWYTRMDPEGPIGAGATGAHGIFDEDVQDEPTFREWIDIVLKGDTPWHPSKGPAFLIMHNAPFDWKFLKSFVDGDVVLVDTLVLARRFYPDAPDHKLQTLRAWLRLPFDVTDAHSAAGDTLTLLNFMLRMSKDTGLTIRELCINAQVMEPITKLPFGKHKGSLIADVAKTDPGWIRWALRNLKDLSPELKTALQEALRS